MIAERQKCLFAPWWVSLMRYSDVAVTWSLENCYSIDRLPKVLIHRFRNSLIFNESQVRYLSLSQNLSSHARLRFWGKPSSIRRTCLCNRYAESFTYLPQFSDVDLTSPFGLTFRLLRRLVLTRLSQTRSNIGWLTLTLTEHLTTTTCIKFIDFYTRREIYWSYIQHPDFN